MTRGDLSESVKRIIGAKALVASFDHHANVTRKIARYADVVVGYNSIPHTAWRGHQQVADLRRVFITITVIVPIRRR